MSQKTSKMRYTPNSPRERAQMLEYLEAEDVDELYADVPKDIVLAEELKLDASLSEQELTQHMGELAGKNKVNTI